jgi:flagellar basal-body rod modification protein FlgD
MGPDTFLKLLVAQMRYQNPLQPSDPTAMLGQVATYAQVEALNQIQTQQKTANALAEARMATDLVGSSVTGGNAQTGAVVDGVVVAARFTPAGPVLVLDSGAELSLSAVNRIGTPSPALPAVGSAGTSAAGAGTNTGSTAGTAAGTATESTSGTTAGTAADTTTGTAAEPVTATEP